MKKRSTVDEIPFRTEKAIIFGDNSFARSVPAKLIKRGNEKNIFNFNAIMISDSPQATKEHRYNKYSLIYLRNGKEYVEEIDCISRIIDGYNEFDSVSALADSEDISTLIWTPVCKNWYLPDGKMTSDKHHLLYQLTMLLFRRFCLEEKGYEIISFTNEANNGEKLKSEIIEYSSLRGLGLDFINWLLMENKFISAFAECRTGVPVTSASLEIPNENYLLCLFDRRDQLLSKSKYVQCYDRLEEYYYLRKFVFEGALACTCGYALLHEVEALSDLFKKQKLVKHMTVSVFEEILPAIDVSFEIAQAYTVEMMERFSDPYIPLLWQEYSVNLGDKFRQYILPVIRSYYKIHEKLPRHLIFALFCTVETYKLYNIEDSFGKALKESSDILSDKSLWGEDLSYLREEYYYFENKLKGER